MQLDKKKFENFDYNLLAQLISEKVDRNNVVDEIEDYIESRTKKQNKKWREFQTKRCIEKLNKFIKERYKDVKIEYNKKFESINIYNIKTNKRILLPFKIWIWGIKEKQLNNLLEILCN